MKEKVKMLGAAVIGGLAGLTLAVTGPATPAFAHASLAGSNPVNGAVLPNPPQRVVLIFSEQVGLVSGQIKVIGPDGEPVEMGQLTVDDTNLIIPLSDASEIGT